MSAPQRYAIVGTAESWKMTPWKDPGLTIASLNDAYRLQGFVRADEWFDFHPLDKFVTAQGIMYAHQIPPGHYLRPAEHLAWLAKQSIPVYLHPDYLTQCAEAANWRHARPIPKAEIEAHFGRYFSSSPQWMLALAMMRGFRDVSIYGIHLATEGEYIDQRPGFEFLIGRMLGAKKSTITVKDGMRHYETADGHIALPEASPVLQAPFQYGFETNPRGYQEPIKWELHKLQVKHGRRIAALSQRPWWSPWARYEEPVDGVPGKTTQRRVKASTLQQEVRFLEAAMDDRRQELMRVNLARG